MTEKKYTTADVAAVYRAADAVPSLYPHPLYSVEEQWMTDGYSNWKSEKRVNKGTTFNPLPGARIVSSQIGDSELHTIMLDVDLPVKAIESSTSGHHHLYIEHPLPWRKYKKLLKALAAAGVIEQGYYKMSVRRKHTALRLPGVKKKIV